MGQDKMSQMTSEEWGDAVAQGEFDHDISEGIEAVSYTHLSRLDRKLKFSYSVPCENYYEMEGEQWNKHLL